MPSNLHFILEGCVGLGAQGKCLVRGSHSILCFFQQKINFNLHKGLQDSSYTGVIYYTIKLFAPQRKLYFFLMCHISLKLQGTACTPLAGGLEMFTQDTCGTMTNICYGVLLHKLLS